MFGDAEQFRFDLENFLRGESSRRRDFMYHTLMAKFHWSWSTVMTTPYDVVLRESIILSVEGDMIEHKRRIAEMENK